MKKSVLQLFIPTSCVLAPVSAWAHMGVHEMMGRASGFIHPITGADHVLAMVAVGLWAVQQGGRALWAVPVAFVAMMMAGGMLGLAGVALPYAEQGILMSVLVLGAVVAGAFEMSLAFSASMVGVFALCHGYMHGVEMPSAANAVPYSLGFVLATVLLHVAGMSMGVILRKLSTEKAMRLAGGAITLGGIYLSIG
ncbi:HupE/UreJ family protein [Methylobacter sp. sgz302048]|uniref:HupE/UreJ family protein n=1 Tax=Methylobacter sp. sgz302048 TaxID=3455945 RepID=UPI003FA182DD